MQLPQTLFIAISTMLVHRQPNLSSNKQIISRGKRNLFMTYNTKIPWFNGCIDKDKILQKDLNDYKDISENITSSIKQEWLTHPQFTHTISFETHFWKSNYSQNWSCNSAKTVAIYKLIFSACSYFFVFLIQWASNRDCILLYYRIWDLLNFHLWQNEHAPKHQFTIFQRWIKKRRNLSS